MVCSELKKHVSRALVHCVLSLPCVLVMTEHPWLPTPHPPRQSKNRRPLTRVAHASKPPKIVSEGGHDKHNQSVGAKKEEKKKANSDRGGGEGDGGGDGKTVPAREEATHMQALR